MTRCEEPVTQSGVAALVERSAMDVRQTDEVDHPGRHKAASVGRSD